jgi:magnesium transporter
METESMAECFQHVGEQEVAWIRVTGTKDAEALTKLGESSGFHPLALEDVMNGGQRPKAEDFGDYIFITIKLPIKEETRTSIRMEQINIFLGPNYVFTISDSGNAFDPVLRSSHHRKYIAERQDNKTMNLANGIHEGCHSYCGAIAGRGSVF